MNFIGLHWNINYNTLYTIDVTIYMPCNLYGSTFATIGSNRKRFKKSNDLKARQTFVICKYLNCILSETFRPPVQNRSSIMGKYKGSHYCRWAILWWKSRWPSISCSFHSVNAFWIVKMLLIIVMGVGTRNRKCKNKNKAKVALDIWSFISWLSKKHFQSFNFPRLLTFHLTSTKAANTFNSKLIFNNFKQIYGLQ